MVRIGRRHISQNQKAKKRERTRKFFLSKKKNKTSTTSNDSFDVIAPGNVPLCSNKTTELYLFFGSRPAHDGTDVLLLCLERIFLLFISLVLVLFFFLFFCESLCLSLFYYNNGTLSFLVVGLLRELMCCFCVWNAFFSFLFSSFSSSYPFSSSVVPYKPLVFITNASTFNFLLFH
jgi:hypothetical protein